jgi:hypothetical protein
LERTQAGATLVQQPCQPGLDRSAVDGTLSDQTPCRTTSTNIFCSSIRVLIFTSGYKQHARCVYTTCHSAFPPRALYSNQRDEACNQRAEKKVEGEHTRHMPTGGTS